MTGTTGLETPIAPDVRGLSDGLPNGPSPRAGLWRPGHARLDVELVRGKSTATAACATNPLKLLIPRPRGPSVWAYTSNFGGGLVAGDETRLALNIGPGARCFVSTQASTKIYRNPTGLPCSHLTHGVIGGDALLVFTPDQVQPFAGSVYGQRQEWHLAERAGLVLLDWFGSGRAARGERWAFVRFQSRNDIFMAGERIFVDSVWLDATDEALSSPFRTGRFDCFAMLLFVGLPLSAFAENILREFSARPIERRASLLCSASQIRGGALLRLAGESTESVGRELRRQLHPLSSVLGDDPWQRKW